MPRRRYAKRQYCGYGWQIFFGYARSPVKLTLEFINKKQKSSQKQQRILGVYD